MAYIKQLKERGIWLKSMTESWLDTSQEGITDIVLAIMSWAAAEERKKILEIHISKLKRDLSKFDLDKLARLSGEEKFGKDVVLAGAELEAWVADSLIEAFSRKINGDLNADLSMQDFETTINRLVPMGQMRKEEFIKLRQWANENAVSASISNVSNSNNEAFLGGRRIDF
jgi:hypothetical protein